MLGLICLNMLTEKVLKLKHVQQKIINFETCLLVGWQMLNPMVMASQGGNLPRDSKQANAERLES